LTGSTGYNRDQGFGSRLRERSRVAFAVLEREIFIVIEVFEIILLKLVILKASSILVVVLVEVVVL